MVFVVPASKGSARGYVNGAHSDFRSVQSRLSRDFLFPSWRNPGPTTLGNLFLEACPQKNPEEKVRKGAHLPDGSPFFPGSRRRWLDWSRV